MNTAIKPIQTVYRGYNFRSRLEARWAVFFDALGLPWEYEPEGFELPDGTRYLPDFRVEYPGRNVTEKHHHWFEVKGDITSITQGEWAKLVAFHRAKGLMLLDGAPDMRMYLSIEQVLGDWQQPRSPISTPYTPNALALTFERPGDALWSHKGRLWWDGYDPFFTDPCFDDSQAQLARAVRAARSARFEHGHSGATL